MDQSCLPGINLSRSLPQITMHYLSWLQLFPQGILGFSPKQVHLVLIKDFSNTLNSNHSISLVRENFMKSMIDNDKLKKLTWKLFVSFLMLFCLNLPCKFIKNWTFLWIWLHFSSNKRISAISWIHLYPQIYIYNYH